MINITLGTKDYPLRGKRDPNIGNNAKIFFGAKILGAINIRYNCIIGANAIITKSTPENCLVVGVDNIIKIKEKDNYGKNL